MDVGWTSWAGDAKVSVASAPSGTTATAAAVRNRFMAREPALRAYRGDNAGVTATAAFFYGPAGAYERPLPLPLCEADDWPVRRLAEPTSMSWAKRSLKPAKNPSAA